MDMKKCKSCSIDKPLTEYYNNKNTKDGLYTKCKKCLLEYTKPYTTDWNISKQGIYEIYDKTQSLYVGQSVRLNNRIAKHKSTIKHPHLVKHTNHHFNLYKSLAKHSNVDIRIVNECSREVLNEREQHYIDVLKPLYNNK